MISGRFSLRRGGFLLDVELALPARGTTAICGRSGAGKSTLLRCMAGLERAPGGFLALGEERWQDEERGLFLPPHRRPVGYVAQEPGLFSHLSVRRNLEYGLRRTRPSERRIKMREAVAWLGAGELLERSPESLSGGERQRVAIARALLTSPSLLLMDEPLAALDPAAREEILTVLERLLERLPLPVLYVSHVPAEALRLAGHLLLLEGGRVRASGPAAEIATRLDLLPWSSEGELAAVLETVVLRHDEEFALSELGFAGGTLTVPRLDRPPGSRQRVRLLARDVGLALAPPAGTSLLNAFPARVVEIGAVGTAAGTALVRLNAGGAPLIAQVTRKSLHLLGVHPGLELHAVIKSVALVG